MTLKTTSHNSFDKTFFHVHIMYHVINETLPGWWRLQAQECGQSSVFLHNDAIHVQQTSNVSAFRSDRNRQCGQEDPGGHPGQ